MHSSFPETAQITNLYSIRRITYILNTLKEKPEQDWNVLQKEVFFELCAVIFRFFLLSKEEKDAQDHIQKLRQSMKDQDFNRLTHIFSVASLILLRVFFRKVLIRLYIRGKPLKTLEINKKRYYRSNSLMRMSKI